MGLLLCPWMWVLLFICLFVCLVESNILLWMVVQQQVVVPEFLQKMTVRPSTLPSCRRYAYEYMTSLFIQLPVYIWVTAMSQLL